MKTAENMTIRDANAGDVPFLWLMLTYAASMPTSDEPAVEAAMKDANLRTYVDDWGRPGDLGVVAVRNGADRVGAAWVRLGGGTSPFKVGDATAPELAVAILPTERAGGVGTAMMRELMARGQGKYPSIVLSVRESNPAVRFYERLGFRTEKRIQNRVGGTSLVMRVDLCRGEPPSKGLF